MSVAEQEQELQQLIAEQAYDMRFGNRVSRPHTVPLVVLEYKNPNARAPKFNVKTDLDPNDPRHGTRAGYVAGCRCRECVSGESDRKKKYRHRVKGTLAPDDHRHGTENAYNNWGCRCEKCKKANTEKQREYQARKKK